MKKVIPIILLWIAALILLHGCPEQPPEPPEITGQVLVNTQPLSLELLAKPGIGALNSPACCYRLDEGGGITRCEEPWSYTQGGIVSPDTLSALSAIRDVRTLIYTQTVANGGILAAFYDREAETPFTLCRLDRNDHLVFTTPLEGFTDEDLTICAMSMDEDEQTVYLFDGQSDTELRILSLNTASGDRTVFTVTWEDIAGPYRKQYHVGGLLINPDHIAVENGVLYVVEQHYGPGDGITRTFVSAYDLAAENLINVHLLGNCELVTLMRTEDSLAVLTRQQIKEPLTLTLLDKQTLEPLEIKYYPLPQPWLELIQDDNRLDFMNMALITPNQVIVQLAGWMDEKENTTYIAAYNRSSGELTYLNRLALRNFDYEIAAISEMNSPRLCGQHKKASM